MKVKSYSEINRMEIDFNLCNSAKVSDLRAARLDARSTQQKWNSNVKLEWETFAFDQSKLSQMISMI